MTGREFLEWAGFEGELEEGLYLLGKYVGKGDFYLQFPDAEITTEDGETLEELPEEPAGFQAYCENS